MNKVERDFQSQIRRMCSFLLRPKKEPKMPAKGAREALLRWNSPFAIPLFNEGAQAKTQQNTYKFSMFSRFKVTEKERDF
ncbi:hypothetical protein LJC32_06815 [Oscillospiraceae bacterium OttesenSCG-928-F05]|nr:hypothetical protein [Oscillospiraceae bacterium OttesenSCG-928-F05]